MPYQLHIEPEGVRINWCGHVRGQDMIRFLAHIHGHEAFDGLRYKLHDFSACTGLSFASEEIEEIAALDAAAAYTNPRIRIAIVSGHPRVARGIAHYAQLGLSPFVIRQFASIHNARVWLHKPT